MFVLEVKVQYTIKGCTWLKRHVEWAKYRIQQFTSYIDIIDYVNRIGNLSRDQYIRTRTSLHHFILSNSIATRPKNGQKPLQLRTYRVIAAKQKQPQGSFELIPVKESLLYT